MHTLVKHSLVARAQSRRKQPLSSSSITRLTVQRVFSCDAHRPDQPSPVQSGESIQSRSQLNILNIINTLSTYLGCFKSWLRKHSFKMKTIILVLIIYCVTPEVLPAKYVLPKWKKQVRLFHIITKVTNTIFIVIFHNFHRNLKSTLSLCKCTY